MTNVIGQSMIGQMSGKISSGQCPQRIFKSAIEPNNMGEKIFEFYKAELSCSEQVLDPGEWLCEYL